MKQILLICALVALVGCETANIADPFVEKAIRNDLKKIFSHRKTVINNILSNAENFREINTVEELVL